MEEWLDNGCKLGWLIDADSELVLIYEQGKQVREHFGFDKNISGEPLLPNFELVLSQLSM